MFYPVYGTRRRVLSLSVIFIVSHIRFFVKAAGYRANAAWLNDTKFFILKSVVDLQKYPQIFIANSRLEIFRTKDIMIASRGTKCIWGEHFVPLHLFTGSGNVCASASREIQRRDFFDYILNHSGYLVGWFLRLRQVD